MEMDSSKSWNYKLHIARVFAGLSWSWLIIFLPGLTNVGMGFMAEWVFMHACPFFAILWVIATVAMFWDYQLPSRAAVCWWLVANAALILVAVLLITHVGVSIRTRISEPWLDEKVAMANQGVQFSREPCTVGLFQVEEIWVHQGAVYFFTGDYGLLDQAGIAFIPNGADPLGRTRVLRHLYGDWYSFVWRF
jgi:hypothetical protein